MNFLWKKKKKRFRKYFNNKEFWAPYLKREHHIRECIIQITSLPAAHVKTSLMKLFGEYN